MSDLRALYTIYFNSNNCDRFNNDTSHVLFRSNNDIIIGDDEDIEILCPQCVLPISFYNVNSNNNSFIYTLSGSTVTVTLTAGNYSASSFVTLFNSLLSGIFVLTYSPATLVFTITHSTTTFSVSSNSTCLNLLGLTGASLTATFLNLTYALTSDKTIDFSYTKNIAIVVSSLSLKGTDSIFKGSSTSVVASVGLDRNTPYINHWQNPVSIPQSLLTRQIPNELEIFLLDDNGNIIPYRNGTWSFELRFYVRKRIPRALPYKNNNNSTINKDYILKLFDTAFTDKLEEEEPEVNNG